MNQTMFKVSAQHATERIRIARPAVDEADAASKAAALEAAGYWWNITVEPFVPVYRKARRAA